VITSLALSVFVFAALLVVFVATLAFARRAVGRGRVGAKTDGRSPRRIHLVPADGVALTDPAGVEALARPLLDRGFADAGTFRIEELGLLVRFLVSETESLYAAIYDRHPAAGTWLDLVRLYEDGTSLTVNNLARASALDERPGHRKVRLGGAKADDVVERMRHEAGSAPALRIAAADIPPRFERAYADEIAWRDARGGPTEDEIRRIAAASGKTLTDAQVRAAKELLEEQARDRDVRA